MNDRDRRILEHILRHCKEIIETVDRFDFSKENFKHDHVFTMPVLWHSFRLVNFPNGCPRSSKTLIQKSLGLK